MAIRILVVDDEPGLREVLEVLFQRHGYEVALATGCQHAIESLKSLAPFEVVVTDLAMPDGSGMKVLEAALERDATTQVIMITAYGTTEQAVTAMRRGAYHYLQKPFKNSQLVAVVEKALEKRSLVTENIALRERFSQGFKTGNFVGKSQAMQRVIEMVKRVASAPSSVLITGESGTGKELVARALHNEGVRADKPFIGINCAALPEPLLESELFGHVKGAFTGATANKEGLFRAAESGTLFLDEIGELPATLQVKLLRVLQERAVRPVGGEKETPVDVRLIAATNRDVEKDVEEGRLRQDLFYRLNVIRLHLPPLRDRPEDIPLLSEHFLKKHAALQRKRLSFAPNAMRWIMSQSFPGNVRELENIVEHAATLAIGQRVEISDLPIGNLSELIHQKVPIPFIPDEGLDLDEYLGEIEKQVLLSALEKAGGVRKNAAQLLNMSFRSLRYRLAKYGFGDDERQSDDELEE
ncbi:MAG: sigma-54-dependent Fis family transcriptional regulator [Deltaproteobacteria bacterium]|nr:sigma-54-dependent Fis family transcriptional regulator [Deltaproteobacteria bacterium]